MTTAVSLALNALVTLALSCGLAAPLAAQSQPEAAMIAPAEAPGDWSAQLFRGIAFSLPPGWQEMTRDDEAAMFFGGDVASRTGPGFGLMLDDDPDATFSGSEVTEKGQVMFGNGRTFRRIESAITESGVGMRADIRIRSPRPGDAMVCQSSAATPARACPSFRPERLSWWAPGGPIRPCTLRLRKSGWRTG